MYLSLPWKVLGFLLALMLLLSLSMTSLWLDKLEQDFGLQQQQNLESARQEYALISDIVTSRLTAALESFVHLQRNTQDPLNAVLEGIATEQDHMQLQWGVNAFWLFDESSALLQGTQMLTESIEVAANQALVGQMPVSAVSCSESCQQILALPILTSDGRVAAMVMSSSMLEILAFLNQSTQAELAIVSAPDGANEATTPAQLSLREPLSAALRLRLSEVLQGLGVQTPVADIVANGTSLTLEKQELLVMFLPLPAFTAEQNWILLVQDISAFRQTYQDYQLRVFLVGLMSFLLIGILLAWLGRGIRQRLLNLSGRLPLLAKHDFDNFRRLKSPAAHGFRDELDDLQDGADQLASELQQLDRQVAQHTRELENIAMYDLITGLPNRNMLNFQLRKALATLHSHPGTLGLLFLDMDDFKKVNDSRGHSVGDKLLLEAAKRLKTTIAPQQLACRFGGDEFVVLVPRCQQVSELTDLAEAILQCFRAPTQIDGGRFYVPTSIGISYTQDSDLMPDDLIRQADVAMYEAKDKGGNSYQLFDQQMFKRVASRVMLESEVNEALQRGDFYFALQPQIDLNNGRLFGFEALLRWRHPQRGMIAPDDFIPALESSEHMLTLGNWGVKRSLVILRQLEDAGFPGLKVAVNLSAAQFLDPALVPLIEEALASSSIAANQLEFELTERSLVADFDATLATMQRLRKLGVTLSIDDFGTGYSSLSYLKQMPVDVIKIDRLFVAGMLDNKADMHIVENTIAMVRSLGMQVIAEGVENSAQLRLLQDYACDMAQGYLFAKPIPQQQLMDELRTQLNERGQWRGFDLLGHIQPSLFDDF